MRTSRLLLILLGLISVYTLSVNAHRPLTSCLSGKHTVIDLTHTLSETDPSDSTNGPHFSRVPTATYPVNYYNKISISMPSGVGTTMDARLHAFPSGKTISDYTLEELISPLVVLDVRSKVSADPDYFVTVDDIHDYERRYRRIPPGAMVVMKSGWYSKYRNETAYRSVETYVGPWGPTDTFHFPGFGTDAAQFLVNERDIHGIGVDTLSVDYGDTGRGPSPYGAHLAMLGADKYNLENLNLADPYIPASGACIGVYPTKILGAPEAPARVVVYA